jgi:hypothetical protein
MSAQLRKLFIMPQSSYMQKLRIFEATCRLVRPQLHRCFRRRSHPPFPPPSATAPCDYKRSAPSKSFPFLLLSLLPRPCSPHCSPLSPLHPTSTRSHHRFPQATGHHVAHAPPSSLSETVLKPLLQVSPRRRPSSNPLSTERRHADWPLRRSPQAAFAATTSARTHRLSTISEPVPSTTPPACRRWFLPTRHVPSWSTPRQ